MKKHSQKEEQSSPQQEGDSSPANKNNDEQQSKEGQQNRESGGMLDWEVIDAKPAASPSPEVIKKPPPAVKEKPRKVANASGEDEEKKVPILPPASALQKGALKPTNVCVYIMCVLCIIPVLIYRVRVAVELDHNHHHLLQLRPQRLIRAPLNQQGQLPVPPLKHAPNLRLARRLKQKHIQQVCATTGSLHNNYMVCNIPDSKDEDPIDTLV